MPAKKQKAQPLTHPQALEALTKAAPLWSSVNEQHFIVHSMGMDMAGAAADKAAPSAAATQPKEDPRRTYARSMCGVGLTNDDAGFTLQTATDYTAAINWDAIDDKASRLAAVNNSGPSKPERMGYGEFGLQWQGCDMATMTKAKTRGELATIFANRYK